jgi:hypothetical protein
MRSRSLPLSICHSSHPKTQSFTLRQPAAFWAGHRYTHAPEAIFRQPELPSTDRRRILRVADDAPGTSGRHISKSAEIPARHYEWHRRPHPAPLRGFGGSGISMKSYPPGDAPSTLAAIAAPYWHTIGQILDPRTTKASLRQDRFCDVLIGGNHHLEPGFFRHR